MCTLGKAASKRLDVTIIMHNVNCPVPVCVRVRICVRVHTCICVCVCVFDTCYTRKIAGRVCKCFYYWYTT